MITIKAFKAFLIINCLFYSVAEAAFFEEKKTGWHWYQDPQPLKIETQDNQPLLQNQTLTATEVVNDYKKELEQRLHLAWANPSFKNVKAYQELQKEILDRAQTFSEMWMKVIYQTPELDHTLITPVNHKARHLYFDQQQKDTVEIIQALSKTHGLFFFFDSQCRFCQAFAPIVELFSKRYHWEVMPVSLDGKPLKEFPRPLKDNGIIEQWKIDRFPALFAVNPQSEIVIPIAYGLTSLDEIEARIILLANDRGDNP